MKMPFMFVRRVPHPTGTTFKFKAVYVVILSETWTLKPYSAEWMQDEILSKGDCFVPDVDIVYDENVFVFDSADSMQNELSAVTKMKELWANLNSYEE